MASRVRSIFLLGLGLGLGFQTSPEEAFKKRKNELTAIYVKFYILAPIC